jgi:putative FmdB family regulatory protein
MAALLPPASCRLPSAFCLLPSAFCLLLYDVAMPVYEFRCAKCGARDEVFTRSVKAEVAAPACPQAGRETGHTMERVVSPFARHMTMKDQVAEAEAKWGKQVNDAMGPGPDVGKYARRYSELAKDLPPEND